MAGVKLSIDQQQLQAVVAAIKSESDGRKLRTELNRDLKKIADPAAQAARTAILSMPTRDARFGDMRSAIASKTTVKVTALGRNTGVNISAPRNGYPRGFKNAPRRFNANSFRHKVFGRDQWVEQVGSPGWFNAASKDQEKYVAAIRDALVRMTVRLAEKH